MILFCPDLTGKEEIKAMLIGNGDFVRPVLNPCIKEKSFLKQREKIMVIWRWSDEHIRENRGRNRKHEK